MNKSEFDIKIKKCIQDILLDEAYKYLAVSYESRLRPSMSCGVEFDTNADIVIHNSLAAFQAIKQQVYSLIETESPKWKILISLKFSELPTASRPVSAPPNNQKRLDAIEVLDPIYEMGDIVLPPQTMEELDNALAALEFSDLINQQWGWKSRAKNVRTILCFYGAPGTGKTMCAHAIAKHLNKKILIASYANIQSMYVGEGPKNLEAVFEKAQKTNALLFFDEADSFLRKRTSDTSSSSSMHYNSMTNEMMKHLEEFNGIIIFATNLTDNTDEAFKTRITASIEFTVPNEDNRIAIIQKILPEQVPTDHPFTEDDYRQIAQCCEGFVGRDIRNAIHLTLCKGAKEHLYPFSVQTFIDCFLTYQKNKNDFSGKKDGVKDTTVSNHLSLMGINGSVIALLTYAAWQDGKETEKETLLLKDIAKILGRTKPVINKITDLPSLIEMCDEIRDTEAIPYTLRYLCQVLAISSSQSAIDDVLDSILPPLKINESTRPYMDKYILLYRDLLDAADKLENSQK